VDLPFDVEGRYRVREVLGSGAYGIVYRVFDERWGQEVALKTIRDVGPDLRQWLKSEYRSLRDIVHPNLVRLHELHVDEESCFFTMDLVANAMPFNRSLSLNNRGSQAEKRSALRRICRAGVQLVDALLAVHAVGKCHRDIKPTNILVTPSDLVVLVDFGMVGAVRRPRELDTTRGFLVGTVEYMAPEQFADAQPLPASDWYGVGLVLYETIVGDLPHGPSERRMVSPAQPPPATALNPSAVPKPLHDLLTHLLQADPAARPSGPEILAVLREQSEDTGTPASHRSIHMEAEEVFLARDTEMAMLRRAMAETRENRFVRVEVVGRSGMGKTALVRRFLDGVRENVDHTSLILEGTCHPHESIPYKAFDELVDNLSRYWLCLDEDAAAALRPDEGTDALALLFPELKRVPVLDVPATPYLRRADPRVLRQFGFQALLAVFEKLAIARDVYVVKVFRTIRAFEEVTLPARCHRYAARRFARLRRASVSRLIRARRSTIAICRPS
jgi:eukaryotic-like serine/threonine-protein kinase